MVTEVVKKLRCIASKPIFDITRFKNILSQLAKSVSAEYASWHELADDFDDYLDDGASSLVNHAYKLVKSKLIHFDSLDETDDLKIKDFTKWFIFKTCIFPKIIVKFADRHSSLPAEELQEHLDDHDFKLELADDMSQITEVRTLFYRM